MFAPLNKLMLTLILITIVIVFIVATVIVFVAKQITLPLTKLSDFAEKIAEGNLTNKLEVHGRDEISKVTKALNNTVSKLKKMIGDISGSANDIMVISNGLASSTKKLKDTVYKFKLS
nr:methyl-accepting chemotaxis protein [Clostridium botulinum]